MIISLDGDEQIHNSIRNVPAGFKKCGLVIKRSKRLSQGFKISARTVIHKSNFRIWPALVKTAKDLGLSSISFLPPMLRAMRLTGTIMGWGKTTWNCTGGKRTSMRFKTVLENLVVSHAEDFSNGFIAESPAKLYKIYEHYAAFYQLALPPFKKCNAPWYQWWWKPMVRYGPVFSCGLWQYPWCNAGRYHQQWKAVAFRKQLDTSSNITCVNCVCYLHLKPGIKPWCDDKIVFPHSYFLRFDPKRWSADGLMHHWVHSVCGGVMRECGYKVKFCSTACLQNRRWTHSHYWSYKTGFLCCTMMASTILPKCAWPICGRRLLKWLVMQRSGVVLYWYRGQTVPIDMKCTSMREQIFILMGEAEVTLQQLITASIQTGRQDFCRWAALHSGITCHCKKKLPW